MRNRISPPPPDPAAPQPHPPLPPDAAGAADAARDNDDFVLGLPHEAGLDEVCQQLNAEHARSLRSFHQLQLNMGIQRVDLRGLLEHLSAAHWNVNAAMNRLLDRLREDW